MPHDTRDEVVDFIRSWSDRSGIYGSKFIGWLGIAPSSLEEARLIVADFVVYYNTRRLQEAREQRKARRRAQRQRAVTAMSAR